MTYKRPWYITALCIFGFGMFGIIAIVLMTPEARAGATALGSWYLPFSILGLLVSVISLAGFWWMRRWGVQLYATFFCINNLVLIATGLWSWSAVIFPALLIALGAWQYKKMQ